MRVAKSLLLALSTISLLLCTEYCRCFSPTNPIKLSFNSKTTAKSGIYSPSPFTRQRLQQQEHLQQRRNKNAVKPLQAAPLLTPLVSILSSPIGSLIVLASIVLVHECGHYFAARSFNISVEEFSVGVGPKVLGFKALGNDFSLRALPLGGYVKFPENYNTTLARELAIADNQAFEEYIQQQNIGFGTQLLNAITFGAVVDKMWTDEKERLKNIAKLEANNPSKKAWWQSFTASPFKNEKSNRNIPDEIEYYTDPTLLQNRPWQERAVVLSGGVIFNLLLAFIIYFGQINIGSGLPQPVFDQGIVVSAAPRPDAAANGKLQKGDVIIGVNGIPINKLSSQTSSSSPTQLESQKAITKLISTIRATPDGESLRLDVIRGDDQKKSPIQVNVQPKRFDNTDTKSPQTIGVLLAPNYKTMEVIKSSSPTEAAGLAAKYVSSLTQETASGIFSFISTLIVGGGGGSNSVSGPVGLIKAGSDIVATRDVTTVLLFAAAISINLGVVNALPIPALDGGQLLFVLAEAVTGKKVDQRIEESVTGVAVLFLILLSVSTLFGDISSIISGS